MNKKKLLLSIVVFLLVIFSSCKNAAKTEIEDRNAYLQANNITVEPTSTGLYYIETETGTGISPQSGDHVKIKYVGKYLDDYIFDSSDSFQFLFEKGQVIDGMLEGVSYMKEGGKATLIIPSNIGYGTQGFLSIPAYSTLVFDIELLDVY